MSSPVPPATGLIGVRARRLSTTFRGIDLLGRIALGVLVGILLIGVAGTFLHIGGDSSTIVGPRLAPPAPGWPLGTDSLGRSLLPRLFEGIATTLALSVLAVAITALVSATAGMIAGYHGGLAGGLIMRIGDILYAFPAIVLAILVATAVGPGVTTAVAAIVLVTVPLMTRMVGQEARSVAGRDFITAGIIAGVSTPRILVRHVLRNVSGTIAVQGTYALSVAILVEGGLSFLGYGVQLPASSLGLLIREGAIYMVTSPTLLLAPGVVLVIAILAINILGDSLRDLFEPRETRSLE
ncbi:MAG: ABC transporter permease [Candidatus Microbacterium colombiense]|nr:MAG: ABC transporter permease [Microbacterium sp.]